MLLKWIYSTCLKNQGNDSCLISLFHVLTHEMKRFKEISQFRVISVNFKPSFSPSLPSFFPSFCVPVLLLLPFPVLFLLLFPFPFLSIFIFYTFGQCIIVKSILDTLQFEQENPIGLILQLLLRWIIMDRDCRY